MVSTATVLRPENAKIVNGIICVGKPNRNVLHFTTTGREYSDSLPNNSFRNVGLHLRACAADGARRNSGCVWWGGTPRSPTCLARIERQSTQTPCPAPCTVSVVHLFTKKKRKKRNHMEQEFRNRVRWLRCTCSVELTRQGPAHASVATATVVVRRRDGESWTRCASAPRNKDAIRAAMHAFEEVFATFTDPCTLPYEDLWKHVCKPICAFKDPPVEWFEHAEVIGVDWEGQPPSLVQIACREGVLVHCADSKVASDILSNSHHTHCVFGAHEEHLVANPLQLQQNGQSLAESLSLAFCPDARLMKDKSIHHHTDWSSVSSLSERALRYAALDAEMTRRLGLRRLRCNA